MSAYLEEHGYAVVASVLDEAGIEKGTSQAWDWLESNPPGSTLRRDDMSTWSKEWLPDPINGIMHGFGFNHSDYAWNLRTRPK